MELIDVAYIITNLSAEDDNEGFLELSRVPVKGEYILIQSEVGDASFVVENVYHTPVAIHHRAIIDMKAV